MARVFFQPWVGTDFNAKGLFSKRTLILGESHYQWAIDKPLTEELTRDLVRVQSEGTYTKQFWTNIAVAFLGRRPTLEEKRRFWHSVAFYNFIQANVGFGPRIRPTPQMWGEAHAPFLEVLEELRPECVIALGYDLWHRMPLPAEKGPAIEGAAQTETRRYRTGHEAHALAYGIRHPSAGFSGRYWYPFVQRALELA
jgi:hypothetical protein